jgi:hypothetical protein
MNIVHVYVDSFKDSIKNAIDKEYKSENEKYLEVCAHYSNIMAALSDHYNKYSLVELLPITNIFKEYQTKYFSDK